eukprot:5094439-Pleurochrysis_carterae.AAC.2
MSTSTRQNAASTVGFGVSTRGGACACAAHRGHSARSARARGPPAPAHQVARPCAWHAALRCVALRCVALRCVALRC